MVFWLYMLAMTLLVPATMILCGRFFLRGGPRKINPFFGYRSRRSSRNWDTWQFAHRYCGKLWFLWGLGLVPITLVVMLFALGRTQEQIDTIGGILTLIQIIPIIGAILATERALKQVFDEYGNRR